MPKVSSSWHIEGTRRIREGREGRKESNTKIIKTIDGFTEMIDGFNYICIYKFLNIKGIE